MATEQQDTDSQQRCTHRDDEARDEPGQKGPPVSLLVAVLDRLDLPEEMTLQARQFSRQADKLRENEEPEELLDQFVMLLSQWASAQHGGTETKPRRQKLLERILSRQDNEQQASVREVRADLPAIDQHRSKKQPSKKLLAPAVGDLLLQMALRMPAAVRQRINFAVLKKHTNKARTRKDLLPIVDVLTQHIDAAYREKAPGRVQLEEDPVQALAEGVALFFRQLQLPPDLEEHVAGLEQYCAENCGDIDSIVRCLNVLAEVAAELGGRLGFLRDASERFLVRLDERLQDIDLGQKKYVALHDASQEVNQQLGLAVNSEIREIRTLMQSSDDLNELRGLIGARLDILEQHLRNFSEQEQQHIQTVQEVSDGLDETITALAKRGGELREHLAERQQRALQDVLTGISSRHACEQQLAAEIARCQRYTTPFCMLVLDIDNLATINDTYGHAAGDRVIRSIAQMLVARVRETDHVARYAGAKFILLMPETTLDAATQVTEQLRISIQDTPFQFHDACVRVTVSAGVTQYQFEETTDSLFSRADAALHEAKKCGRNRIKAA